MGAVTTQKRANLLVLTQPNMSGEPASAVGDRLVVYSIDTDRTVVSSIDAVVIGSLRVITNRS